MSDLQCAARLLVVGDGSAAQKLSRRTGAPVLALLLPVDVDPAPQPGGRDDAVARGQDASRGEPVCTSSGKVTVTVSSRRPAREVTTLTSVAKLPARADRVSHECINMLTRTVRRLPAGIVNSLPPSASVMPV